MDTVVFMVDIPALAKNRMRKAPIEFWKPGMADQLRKASWVYSPDWDTSELPESRVESNVSEDRLFEP